MNRTRVACALLECNGDAGHAGSAAHLAGRAGAEAVLGAVLLEVLRIGGRGLLHV